MSEAPEAVTVPVTIVIPIRNAERHVSNLVANIEGLRPQPTQIVIVLDACTDRTPTLLQERLGGRPEVELISLPEARGSGNARNVGLRHAKAAYVWFADCDDQWDADVLGRLVASAERHSADIVVCAADIRYPDVETVTNDRFLGMWGAPPVRVLTGTGAASNLLRGSITGHLWTKLFRASLLPEDPFSTLSTHQDLYSTLELLLRARTVVVIKDVLYGYVQHRSSNLMAHKDHCGNLIRVRDHFRSVLAHEAPELTPLLPVFEFRFIALPMLQNAAATPEELDYDREAALQWADKAVRHMPLLGALRQSGPKVAAFTGLVKLGLHHRANTVYRQLRSRRLQPTSSSQSIGI